MNLTLYVWRQKEVVAGKASAAGCGMMVNGKAHGPQEGTCLCQLHMRTFRDGDALYLEPWRARAFPVIRDLVVEGPAALSASIRARPRTPTPSRFPRRMLISPWTPPKCIGCGAQGGPVPERLGRAFRLGQGLAVRALAPGPARRQIRVQKMVEQMESECEVTCPKEISLNNIARMNRDQIVAKITKGA